MAVLSKPKILEHLKAGNIIISPFSEGNLSNTSYDVRLGKYFYRQSAQHPNRTLNPFYEKSVFKLYSELEEAAPIGKLKSGLNPYDNLSSTDLVILVAPNETILTHTIEFIGGKNGTKDLPAITTEMRARSSTGRIGIAVCKCAGWGDIGYVNRWTMEITNFSNVTIPLPVGLRIAQIVFHETTAVENVDKYARKGGKYQTASTLSAIKKSWKPESILPKLYKDKDIGHFSDFNKY